MKSLSSEVQGLTGQAHYRTSREFDRTNFVDQNAAALEHSLVLVLVLGHLRDGMFDNRDRQRVEASLSVAAAMANDYSAEVQQAANQTLATVGRPGIAVDMAKYARCGAAERCPVRRMHCSAVAEQAAFDSYR